MANDGTLDGCDTDVEEALLVVNGQAIEEEVFWLIGIGSTMRKKNSKDRLYE